MNSKIVEKYTGLDYSTHNIYYTAQYVENINYGTIIDTNTKAMNELKLTIGVRLTAYNVHMTTHREDGLFETVTRHTPVGTIMFGDAPLSGIYEYNKFNGYVELHTDMVRNSIRGIFYE